MDLRIFILDYLYIKTIEEYVETHKTTEHFILNFSDGCYNPHLKTFLTFKEFYNYYVNKYYYSPHIKLPRRHRPTLLTI
tara:strand:+ start:2416 stop:2652 length:237 start_codon:yes stop_codon:yes gene_type:complete